MTFGIRDGPGRKVWRSVRQRWAGSFQADQALQAFEAKVDPPSEAIKSENVGGREGLGRKRGHQDHPLRGGECSFGNLMALLSRLSTRHPPRGLGGMPGLLDGDEPQSERPAALASNKDRSVDQSAVRRLAELSEKIDRRALGVEPTGVSPAGADQHVGVLLEHEGDAVGLWTGAIGDADLAFDHRDPIEGLAPMLIGQLEMTEALARKV